MYPETLRLERAHRAPPRPETGKAGLLGAPDALEKRIECLVEAKQDRALCRDNDANVAGASARMTVSELHWSQASGTQRELSSYRYKSRMFVTSPLMATTTAWASPDDAALAEAWATQAALRGLREASCVSSRMPRRCRPWSIGRRSGRALPQGQRYRTPTRPAGPLLRDRLRVAPSPVPRSGSTGCSRPRRPSAMRHCRSPGTPGSSRWKPGNDQRIRRSLERFFFVPLDGMGDRLVDLRLEVFFVDLTFGRHLDDEPEFRTVTRQDVLEAGHPASRNTNTAGLWCKARDPGARLKPPVNYATRRLPRPVGWQGRWRKRRARSWLRSRKARWT